MAAVQFVHAADLHLDTPFESIGRVAPTVAQELRDASLKTWDGLVQLCIDQNAAFLLLAGDIYDGEDRGVRAQVRFRRGLERLFERGIQTLIVHGNHDPNGGRWSAIREWPPGVTVFGHECVQSMVLERDGSPLAVVHGISYATRDVADNLALRFRRGPESAPHFGLLHCNVGCNPDHPAYSPCTLDDLRAAGMDYWALGHIHVRQILASSDPWIVYPGNLQGRSLKPSEQGLKGATVGTIEYGRIVNIQFAPIPHVRFADIDVDVTALRDLPEVVARLEEEVEIEKGRGPLRGLIARAALTGRGPIHEQLQGPGKGDGLLRTLREEAADQVPFVWWSAIDDATQPSIDRNVIRERGDFSAELIKLAEGLAADHERLNGFVDEQTGELLRPGIRRWVHQPTNDSHAALDHALTLALEQIETRTGQ